MAKKTKQEELPLYKIGKMGTSMAILCQGLKEVNRHWDALKLGDPDGMAHGIYYVVRADGGPTIRGGMGAR